MENKTCKYAGCKKEFTPNHGKQLYCSPNCKAYDFAKNKQVKKLVLIQDDEDGNFLFMNPDGTTRKCKLVWAGQEEKKFHKSDSEIKQDAAEKAEKENEKVDLSEKKIPPMPVKEKGEDSFDFAARKNEWKKKYNQ